jgi:hypothetical protein
LVFLGHGSRSVQEQFAKVKASSQAKCPILVYSNLPLGVIHVLSESSNQHALSFASTNEIVEEFGNF